MLLRLQYIVVFIFWIGVSLVWRESIRTTINVSIPAVRTHLEWCRNGEEIYPGEVNKSSERWAWEPDICNIKHYTPTEIEDCVSKKSILGVGDSLIGNAMWSIHYYGGVPTVRVPEWDNITEELTIEERLTYKKNSSFFKKRLPAEGKFFSVSEDSPTSSMWWAPTQNPRPNDDMRLHPIYKSYLKEADMVLYGGGIWDLGRASCGVERYFDSLTRNLKSTKKQMKSNSVILYMPFHWLQLNDKNIMCNHPDRLASYREAGQLAASCAGVGYLTTAPITRYEVRSSIDGVHYSFQMSTMELDLALNSVCGNITYSPPDIPCNTDTINKYKKLWGTRPANKQDCCVKNTVCGCPLDVEGVDIF